MVCTWTCMESLLENIIDISNILETDRAICFAQVIKIGQLKLVVCLLLLLRWDTSLDRNYWHGHDDKYYMEAEHRYCI